MGFYSESQGTNTFLSYKIETGETVDTLGLGMLTNNKIKGIIPTLLSQLDENKYLEYNISAKITAKEFLAGSVTRKRLLGIFSSILQAIISAEEYMLDINTLLFDLEYIFVDASTCRAEMICLPIIEENKQGIDLSLFFKNIMFSTQFDSTESSEHIAKIMNYLNSSPTLDVEEFKTLVDEMENEPDRDYTLQKREGQFRAENSKIDSKIQQSLHSQNAQWSSSVDISQKQEKPMMKSIQQEGTQMTDYGDNISLFYLLQHYNKDNAAKYKEQKNNKKNLKSEKGSKTSKSSKEKKTKKQKNTSAVSADFAVPGQKESFAIPGQSQSIIKSENEQKNDVPVSKEISAYKETVDEQSKPTYIPPTLEREDADFGNTVVMGDDMEFSEEATVLINNTVDMEAVPYLIRCKTNEKTMINKPLIKIGRDHKTVDYCISDNKAIGRNHANILFRGGEYFVVDINSINHTFVDDRMIPSGAETKLSHGAKLRLADEDFEFRMF